MKYFQCKNNGAKAVTRRRSGFTLIELLVVIAIIAILAAILFPVFGRAKETARRTMCSQHMKQLNVALICYTDDNQGKFPNSVWFCKAFAIVQQPSLVNGPFMQDLLDKYIKSRTIWQCPSISPNMNIPGSPLYPGKFEHLRWADNRGKAKDSWSSYMWNHIAHGDKGVVFKVSGSRVSDVDKPTDALTFIECPYWGVKQPHSQDEGLGVNMAFYDGHVKFTKTETNVDPFYEWSWRGWYKHH